MSAHELSLIEARDAIAARTLGAAEFCRALLDRTAAIDSKIGAYLEVHSERAMARAREVDAALARGETVGPLAGVAVAIKDNICLDHGRTTCASKILERYESPFSATAAARLERAGAVVTGKTNLDEFAMGSSTQSSALGVTSNPWDVSRVPGGSSGGSAAAVAARLVPGALGSDTGGSVRQPAAHCGVVGLKPTYGRVSRWGLVAYASSLDQIGPMARTVADVALLTEVIAGADELDSTCARREAPSLLRGLDEPIAGLRVGVPAECRSASNHPAVAAAFEQAIRTLADAGATIVDVHLPRLKHGVAAYYVIAVSEASSNLARFDGVRYGRRAALKPGEELLDLYERSRTEGFGAEVQRRIMLGTYTLSSGYYDAYYLTALKARRLIREDFDRVFASTWNGAAAPGCDVVLMPATVAPAGKRGENASNPLAEYLEDVYTVTANLAGVPAISVPAGFAEVDGVSLPVGVQLLAPMFEEARLLRAARMFEAATGHARRAPAL